jgi:AAA+ ATPase superfamily predicted ATPase
VRINAGGLSSLVIGREIEKKTLATYIELSQHCAIVAPRRYGKTTLVNSVLNELDESHLVIKLDLMAASSVRELCVQMIDAVYASHGVANFFKNVSENMLELISRFKLDTEYVSIGYDIIKEQDESSMLKQAFELPEIFAKKFNKKSVVFIDEFGDIDRFGVDLIKKMRSYFQQQSHSVYIFAGSQTSMMNKIFLDKENAFFNFASIMRIGFIDESDCKTYLKNLSINKVSFSSYAIAEILRITKGHPFYLVKLLQEAYIDFITKPPKKSISVKNVKLAINKILDDNAPFFVGEWERINKKKHKGRVFKELINISSPDTSLINSSYKSQMIRELKDESILNDDKTPADPVFAIWMNINI